VNRQTQKRPLPLPRTEVVPLESYTRVGVVRGLPVVLSSLGVDIAETLASVGVPADIFDDLDNRIELSKLQELLAACQQLTHCDPLTHLICRHTRLADFGLAGRSAFCGASVGEGLHRFGRHFNLHNSVATMDLITAGGFTRFVYAIFIGGMTAAEQIQLGAATIAYNALQDLCGQHWSPTVITFACRPPSDLRPLQQYFRAPMRFDSPESAVIFEQRWLDRPMAPVDPAFRRQVESEIRASQAAIEADFPTTLRRLLRRQLLMGRSSMDDVAAVFGVHRRTLDRHLQQHGIQFGELVGSVRRDVALLLLRDTRIQVQQIAESLHYSSAANFATTFRRWTGMTPSEYRSRC